MREEDAIFKDIQREVKKPAHKVQERVMYVLETT